jgi:hypothetical protein
MNLRNTTILMCLFCSCSIDTVKKEGLHTIDTGAFQIEVPRNWVYKKEKGIDSFVGKIVGDSVKLSFDYSEAGYANSLLSTENDYFDENESEWMPISAPYFKMGVTYTSGSVVSEREKIMKEEGIKDTSLVKVENFQIPTVKIQKEEKDTSKGDYQIRLTYKDTSVVIGFKIPNEIKQHNFEVDTVDNIYYRKIIYPKETIEDGITGIYFKDLKSNFKFNICGHNLSKANSEKAIKAFKSLKIKRK